MTPKIEVCIPVRNEAERIGQVLEALQRQTFKDFVVKVYDNHSDDGTIDMCQRFAGDLDIEVFPRARNSGQTVNINRSFLNAKSEYVAIVSGNDIVSDNYLEGLLGELEQDPDAVLAYGHSVLVDERGEAFPDQPQNWDFFSISSPDPVQRACEAIGKYCQAGAFFALYRKAALDRMQPQLFCYGGDHIFIAEAAIYGSIRFCSDVSTGRSVPPASGSAGSRVMHLLNLFSLDHQRGLPRNSKMSALEYLTPYVDMHQGYMECFRLADIDHAQRGALVVNGTRAFMARFGQAVAEDAERLIGHLSGLVDALAKTTGGDQGRGLLDRMLIRQALRKIDETEFLYKNSSLGELRARLSTLNA
ncbi:glycosyltransferase family 2 protein [Maricaulis sp. CAU 1757]